MTTCFSTPTATRQTADRVGVIVLWITQVAVAGMFLFAGGLKLTGAPEMVATFDTIGLGQWFRSVTGAIEVVSAVALLVPSLAPFGALLLVPTMVGAIATHLFIVGGSAMPAIVLLIASLAIAWARRGQLVRALSETALRSLSAAGASPPRAEGT